MSAQPANYPFAIQLEVELLDRLSEPVREGRVKSVSDLIRAALERYDFDNVVVVRPAQLPISVRLPLEIRRKLKQLSKAKHTSVGQLVRAAVEAYLPQLEHEPVAGGIEMPIPHVELPEVTAEAEAPAKTKATPARRKSTGKKTRAPKPTRKTRKAAPRKSRAKAVKASSPPAATGRGIAAARGRGMTRKRAQG